MLIQAAGLRVAVAANTCSLQALTRATPAVGAALFVQGRRGNVSSLRSLPWPAGFEAGAWRLVLYALDRQSCRLNIEYGRAKRTFDL